MFPFKNWFRRKIRLKNTRRFKRIKAAYLVKYEAGRTGEPRITNARDIGAGGLRFWTPDLLPESSSLKISVYLPPLDRTVDALAKVVRIRRSRQSLVYSVAVCFLELKQEDREAINEYAETLSKDKAARFVIDHADVVVRRK